MARAAKRIEARLDLEYAQARHARLLAQLAMLPDKEESKT
jgi:hypothetical protein